MVQIGTIEYVAEVTGAGDARSKTDSLQESQERLADTSGESAGALNGFAGTVQGTGEEAGRASFVTGIFDHSLRILGSTVFFVGGILTGFAKAVGVVAVALKGGALAVGVLTGTLSGLTLGGVVGTAVAGITGFVGWLAAGSAGALAFAGVIGVGIGVLGAWILHVTGALDAVQRFGAWVGNVLPDWVRDGMLAVLGVTVGPLAALGGFIIGTFEGGFSEGVDRAREVMGIWVGAIDRTTDRVVGLFRDMWDRILGMVPSPGDLAPDVGDVPLLGDVVDAGADVADFFGGLRGSLPGLQAGGRVGRGGIAQVHEGEAVIPRPFVEAVERADAGRGRGGDTFVDTIVVNIDGADFDPSDMSRRDVQDFAERIARALGRETSTVAGTR